MENVGDLFMMRIFGRCFCCRIRTSGFAYVSELEMIEDG